MKKKILFFVLLLVLFRVDLWAQPTASTAEDPIWYYIQVVGEGAQADRVFTYNAEDGRVYGQLQYASLDRTLIDTQLWRLEKTGTVFEIINKASGKKLDAVYNSTLRNRIAIGSDASSTNWRLYKNGNYYNIRLTVEPEGGTEGASYAFQSPSAGGRNYVITFNTSDQRTSVNALFFFTEFDENLPEASVGSNDIWYFITTEKTGNEGKCITVASNPTDPEVKFSIEPKDKNNENQYWKFTTIENSPGKYQFINKGTGRIISTDAVLDRYFYAQYTDQIEQSNGWSIIPISDGQYEFQGVTNENIIRYLYANSAGEMTATHTANVKNTGFAWSFEWIEGKSVSITDIKPGSKFNAYSENNKIIVTGTDDYVIRNIYGIEFNKNSYLTTGIYLVTANGETKKVLVK